jgi:dUTP pyrophosphatase
MSKDIIKFARIREGAIIPSKREEDGCYDIYANFDEDYIEIKPNEIKMIPTGIASAFDSKYRIGIRERGSTGTKGMSVRSGQIDSGYRGEWFIPINNTSNKTMLIAKYPEDFDSEKFVIYPYKKAIAQAALEFVPDVDVEEVFYDELQKISSERGAGKLGSSGK